MESSEEFLCSLIVFKLRKSKNPFTLHPKDPFTLHQGVLSWVLSHL
uniref:Macaca fascicularis brain cDNA, clone: QflA-17993 n=1 Tax=Macaca fascicularis TaxID=9541 RepID=I7GLF2_MACFA|nr:unnamed protein product [Macaca fascicularis]